MFDYRPAYLYDCKIKANNFSYIYTSYFIMQFKCHSSSLSLPLFGPLLLLHHSSSLSIGQASDYIPYPPS